MPEEKAHSHPRLRTLIVLLIIVVVFSFAIQRPGTALNVLLVMLGFGAVIMIHEFGHFIVAKLSGIKVEAFSIGFPPTLIALQKIKGRLHTLLLPKGPLNETQGNSIQKAADTWETEYRIGLIPFGGFVKMLGQADTGAAEQTDDPRSYTNKPIIVRIAVVAAGVIFNALSAILIFVIIFLVGKNLVPPVIGDVVPDSPAYIAGLRSKDKIIEIDGEKFIDFTNLLLAAALTEKGQGVPLLVEHPSGAKESFFVIPELSPSAALRLRSFGISMAETLTIERKITKPKDIEYLNQKTGLKPGDAIKAVNHTPVKDAWQFREIVENSLMSQATLTVERTDPETSQKSSIDIELPLEWGTYNPNFKTHYDLAHIYSMIPRLKVVDIPKPSTATKIRKKLKGRWRNNDDGTQEEQEADTPLQPGDVIVKIAEIENPTFEQLRKVTSEYEDKDMPVIILRTNDSGNEEFITVITHPRKHPGSKNATIGIYTGLDAKHPVVAQTIDIKNGPAALNIPSGATIEKVDGQKIDNFYDIARIIRKNHGQRINIDYRMDERNAGSVSLNIPADNDYVTVKTNFHVQDLLIPVPLEALTKEYKAANPLQAVQMGLKRTWMFIQQTFLTLKRLATKDVTPKALTGPVGIVSMSYKLAQQDIADYIYFLGLISSCIAVMNLLPFPIVDGGVIVMLIIEKIKGSPISPRIQEIISYIGLVLIIALFLWITYQDVLNQFLAR